MQTESRTMLGTNCIAPAMLLLDFVAGAAAAVNKQSRNNIFDYSLVTKWHTNINLKQQQQKK